MYDGKVVLITGGGGGIGRAAARRFLDEGASVVLSGTRASVLEAAQAELDPTGERTLIVARPDRPAASRRRRSWRRPSSASAASTCSSTAPASSA